MSRFDELAVDVQKLVRPWETPATHLAWLAWGLSVDLWEPEWSEERYRTLTARSLPMHARKGTQASIAEHKGRLRADPSPSPSSCSICSAFRLLPRAQCLVCRQAGRVEDQDHAENSIGYG